MANITKRNIFEALNKVNFTEDIDLGEDIVVTPEHIREFIDKSLAQLDARTVKAAERQAAKKAEGDALRSQIKATLSENPMKIADVVAALDDPEVTTAKVVARMTQLVNLGEVVKSEVKEDGRTLKVYTLA